MPILDHTPYCYLYNRGNNIYDLFVVISLAVDKEVSRYNLYRDGSGTSLLDISVGNSQNTAAHDWTLVIYDVKGNFAGDTAIKVTCITTRNRSLTLEFADADTTNQSLTVINSIAKNVPYLSLTRQSTTTNVWEPHCRIYADAYLFSTITDANQTNGDHTVTLNTNQVSAQANWIDMTLATYTSTSSSSNTGSYELSITTVPKSKGKLKHLNYGLQPGTSIGIFFMLLESLIPPVIMTIIRFLLKPFFKKGF